MEERRRMEALDTRFEQSLLKVVAGAEEATLLYSGGVDSTIIAVSLKDRLPLEVLSVGLPGSRDPVEANRAANLLGLPIRTVWVEEEDALRLASSIQPLLERTTGQMRSVQVALALAVRASKSSRVVVGQGADELFGGYAHFRGLPTEEASHRREHDLLELLGRGWPLSQSIARTLGKDLRSPYLEEPFLDFARRLTIERTGPGELTKRKLREWAVHRGVPPELAMRPKLAMQYGTGVSRILRRHRRAGPGDLAQGMARGDRPRS